MPRLCRRVHPLGPVYHVTGFNESFVPPRSASLLKKGFHECVCVAVVKTIATPLRPGAYYLYMGTRPFRFLPWQISRPTDRIGQP